MPSFEAISKKLKQREQSELAADAGRKVRARLRALTYKEPPREVSSGEFSNLDFESKMAMIGLGEELKPAFGRPSWKPEFDPKAEAQHELDVMIAELDLQEYEHRRKYEESEWRMKLAPAIRAQVEAELAARQPVATPPAASPIPQPIPSRVAPGELRLVRNAVGRIAAAVAPGLRLQVSSRDGNGRIAALSLQPEDGPPCRVVAKRDRAGMLIGLTMEDR